ncbi:MAG: hypothetical protein IH934_00370 [Nanoarchaeota archaeon]|nr:hypothetical protein [Nanoarchaeota archaeon]
MSFIRVKKIAGKEYAYLVENKWYKRRHKGKNKGPRQKVSKYLGRVYRFNKEKDIDFFSFKNINNLEQYLKNNNKNKIFRDLVEWELFRHNINNKEFIIDFTNKKIMKGKKEISLRMNEGFLNSFTLGRLFNINSNDSYYLAKCFVEAGIEIPKEVFVGVFGK